MGNSYYLCANETIKSQTCENFIEVKNDNPSTRNLNINNKNLIKNDNPLTRNFDINDKNLITNDNHSTTNLDINNKNLIVYDNHSNNTVIITKAKKMNEYENIKSEKDIESIKSLYVLKNIFSFLSEKQKLKIIIYNKDLKKKYYI